MAGTPIIQPFYTPYPPLPLTFIYILSLIIKAHANSPPHRSFIPTAIALFFLRSPKHPNMTPLTTLLLVFPLLTPNTAIRIATYDQAGSTRVPGYTGPPTTQLTGDILTNTFCYCAPTTPGGNASRTPPSFPPSFPFPLPPNTNPPTSTDHYQIDYYNHHLFETLIIKQTCLRGADCSPCHERPTRREQTTCDFANNRDCTAGVERKDCLAEGANSSLLVGRNQRGWEGRWFRASWAGFWRGRVSFFVSVFEGEGRVMRIARG